MNDTYQKPQDKVVPLGEVFFVNYYYEQLPRSLSLTENLML